MKKNVKAVIAAVCVAGSVLCAGVSYSGNEVSAVSVPDISYCEDCGSVQKYVDLVTGHVVYYPNELKNSNRKFPVIVWGNGTWCPSACYEKLLSEIAMEGYIVAANSDLFCGNGKSQAETVNYIINKSNKKNGLFYNKVDAENIGAVGHSQGGRSTVNAAMLDSRIDCVVSIAGNSTKKEAAALKVPSMFLTGENDYIVPKEKNVIPAYNECNNPAVYASLKNGYHMQCCFDSEIYSYYTVKWFDAYLKNDSSALGSFRSGGKMSKDIRWTDFKSKNIK